jgi:tetratricopeptide (TPR) repeat protein
MQLLAWLVAELPAESLVEELRARGTDFEPSEEYLGSLRRAGADTLLVQELQKAHHHQTSAQARDPEDLATLVQAAIAKQDKDYLGALRQVAAVGARHRDSPDLYLAGGRILQNVEDWFHAGQAYARAAQLAPNFPYTHGLLSYVNYRMGNGAEAVTEARTMLALQPNSAEAHKYLGLALELRGDFRGALEEYGTALRLRPNYADVYYDMGNVRSEQRDWNGAIAAYEHAVGLDPERWAFRYNLGIAYKRAGRFDDAVRSYQKAKALAPNQLEVRQNLGAALCDSGRYPEAIGEFTELLKIAPDWNMARPCLFTALMRTGRREEAQKVKEEYLQYGGQIEDPKQH